jgi:hypothetical protein
MMVKMQQKLAQLKMMGQLKAGISFQEYVSCDNDVVMCEVQTLEQMVYEKFSSDVSEGEEEDGGKGEHPATFSSALEGMDTMRKYLLKFYADNTMADFTSIENEVYRIQQKAKKQQLTLMNMWKK